MNLPSALRKALAIVRDEKRAAYLEATSCRYRIVPSDHPRGYTMLMSVRYNDEWQPWGEVGHFDVGDILYDKWRLV